MGYVNMVRKIDSKPITVSDLNEFAQSAASDFQFEMRVRKMMQEAGFRTWHSGHYIDQETGKTREYDLRGLKQSSDQDILRVSVECKNIRSSAPLLLSRRYRMEEECSHMVYLDTGIDTSLMEDKRTTTKRFLSHNEWGSSGGLSSSLFWRGAHVAVGVEQVGRQMNGEKLLTSFSDEMWGKWTQAISSMQAFAQETFQEMWDHRQDMENWDPRKAITYRHMPFLVAPDDMMYCIDYDLDGEPDRNGVKPLDFTTVPFAVDIHPPEHFRSKFAPIKISQFYICSARRFQVIIARLGNIRLGSDASGKQTRDVYPGTFEV